MAKKISLASVARVVSQATKLAQSGTKADAVAQIKRRAVQPALPNDPVLEITRARWDATPAENKRRHKNGSCFLVARIEGEGWRWVPVKWTR